MCSTQIHHQSVKCMKLMQIMGQVLHKWKLAWRCFTHFAIYTGKVPCAKCVRWVNLCKHRKCLKTDVSAGSGMGFYVYSYCASGALANVLKLWHLVIGCSDIRKLCLFVFNNFCIVELWWVTVFSQTSENVWDLTWTGFLIETCL